MSGLVELYKRKDSANGMGDKKERKFETVSGKHTEKIDVSMFVTIQI